MRIIVITVIYLIGSSAGSAAWTFHVCADWQRVRSSESLRRFIVGNMRGQPVGAVVPLTTIHNAAVAAGFDLAYLNCRSHTRVLVMEHVVEKGVRGYRLMTPPT